MTTLKQDVRKAAQANATATLKAGEARVLSARVTFRAVSEEAIGKGKAYADQNEYAAALGVSPAQVTGLKRLGKALSLGCTPEDAQWGLLSRKAGTKAVGDAVDADGATPASIYGALAQAFTPDGKANGPRKAASEKEATEKAAPATRPATMAETLAHLAVLLRDVEDVDAVGRKVANILRAEKAARAKAAKAAKVA